MDIAKRIAQNLIEQRTRRGLSPEDLARSSSISLPHLEALEAGEEQPELETLMTLARSLDAPIASFAAGLTWDPGSGFTITDSD